MTLKYVGYRNISIAFIGLLIAGLFFSAGCKTQQKTGNTPTKETKKEQVVDEETKTINFKYNFSEANKYKMLGEAEKALDFFSKCLEYKPESAASRYEIALLLIKNKEYEAAKEQMEKAVKIIPDNKWYNSALANIYKQVGQFNKAIDIYKQLVAKHPKDENFYKQLGSMYASTGQYEKAIDIYNKAEYAVFYSNSIGLARLQIYKETGNKNAILTEYKKLVELNPNNANILESLAIEAENNGNTEVAIDAYKKLLKIAPSDVFTREKLLNHFIAEKMAVEAIEQLEYVLDNPRFDAQKKRSFMRRIISIGLNEKQNKRIAQLQLKYDDIFSENMTPQSTQKAEILRLYDEVLKNTNSINNWYKLLEKCHTTAHYQELYKYGHEAVELYPNMPLLYYYAGIGALNTGKTNQAADYFEMGKTITIDDKELKNKFLEQQANVHLKKGDFADAYIVFEKLLAQNVDNTLWLHSYSKALIAEGKSLDKAAIMMDKCIKISPTNASFLATKSKLHFLNKEYQKAKDVCEKSLASGGNSNSDIVELYGDILFQSGSHSEALVQWKLAKQMGKENAVLDKKISTKSYIEK